MNLIKRIFLFPFLIGCFVATAHAIFILFSEASFSLSWASVLLSCGAMASFMTYLMLAGAASTSRYLPIQLSAAVIGAGMALYDFQLLPSLYTLIFGVLGVFLYVFWYSRLSRSLSAILQKGSKLLEFELVDERGKAFSSQDFIGKKTILLFYRGSWCPLCVAQIKDLSAQYQKLQAQGVNVVMVSPQSQVDSKKLAEKFDVPFVFAFDKNAAAAKKLGIFHKNGTPPGLGESNGGDTVMPTVIICDERGEVLWADQTDNYRVRPEPEMFMQVLGIT